MSGVQKQFNWRSTGLVIAAGATVILVAAQLVAKPNPPRPRTTVVLRPAQPGTDATGLTPPAPPIAAEPALRNFFQPQAGAAAKPGANTPNTGLIVTPGPLPNSNTTPPASTPGTSKPAQSSRPQTVLPSAPSAPAGPSASDIQMLGVVEVGGEPKALLKKNSTGESRYFAKGEEAFGFTLQEIKESEVSLAHQGRTERVQMSSAVQIEGPGATASSGSSGFSGGNSFSGRRFTGGDGGRSGRRNRGDDNDRGSGGGQSGFDAGQLMSLPTWTERLKKLEEMKAQVPPDTYARLKPFFERRAADEKK